MCFLSIRVRISYVRGQFSLYSYSKLQNPARALRCATSCNVSKNFCSYTPVSTHLSFSRVAKLALFDGSFILEYTYLLISILSVRALVICKLSRYTYIIRSQGDLCSPFEISVVIYLSFSNNFVYIQTLYISKMCCLSSQSLVWTALPPACLIFSSIPGLIILSYDCLNLIQYSVSNRTLQLRIL